MEGELLLFNAHEVWLEVLGIDSGRVDANGVVTMTKKKDRANRQNSAKSTGPGDTSKTKLNALQHGLSALTVTELDRAEFQDILQALQQELSPHGMLEHLLIERLALYATRLRRVAKLEGEYIAEELNPSEKEKGRKTELFDLASAIFDRKPLADRSALSELKSAVEGLPGALSALVGANDSSPDFEKMRAALDRFSAAVEALPGGATVEAVPRRLTVNTVSTLEQKFQRYETSLENRFFRTLNEYERLKRLRAGEPVPPPVTVNVALHGEAAEEQFSPR